ncbi:MAG: hypothetical protein KC468_06440, partial [Myxococcales bacterium]|nr:hypothetical protein [Myxococcales bacterium]
VGLVVGLVGVVGLLARVPHEEPDDEPPSPVPAEPEPEPPRPVRPFAVNDARALPTELPPLPEVDLRPGLLPELVVRGIKLRHEGHVTWLDDPLFDGVLRQVRPQESDGAGVFYMTANMGREGDVLVRGGEVYTDVLRQLGVERETLSCSDARAGRLLLVTRDDAGLTAWLFGESGPIQRIDLGIDYDRAAGCEAHLDDRGHFVVQADRRAIWDGERITRAVAGTEIFQETRFGTSTACAPACSPYERDPKTEAFAAQIETTLGCEPRLRLEGAWLLGTCGAPDGPVARVALDGPCCDPQALPADPEREGLALTRTGDVVLRLDAQTLRLWTTTGELGPRMQLGDDDSLSTTGPALLLRGLPRLYVDARDTVNPPWAATPWVEPWGRYPGLIPSRRRAPEGGSDTRTAEQEKERILEEARTWRAALPTSISADVIKTATAHFGDDHDLRQNDKAVVDRRCGHVIWLDEHYIHGQPSSMQRVFPNSTRSPRCQRLDDFAPIHETTGYYDRSLIARTARGGLALAWRPPHEDDDEVGLTQLLRDGRPPRPPFHGWIDLGVRGAIDDEGSWSFLSNIVALRVGDRRLIINGALVHTLPLDAEPLRARPGANLLAAHGDRVIVCAPGCRSIDPGLGRPVTAAVLLDGAPPRLLIRDDSKAHALVHRDAPAQELPEHPLAAILREQFARRDRERREFTAEFAVWVEKAKKTDEEAEETAAEKDGRR